MGLAGKLPQHLPEGQVARQRELRTAVDKKLAKLKDMLSSCVEVFMELEGGGLWEGLTVMCACRQWEAVKDICQLFYQVRSCEQYSTVWYSQPL